MMSSRQRHEEVVQHVLKTTREKQAEIFSGLSGLFRKSRKGNGFSGDDSYQMTCRAGHAELDMQS